MIKQKYKETSIVFHHLENVKVNLYTCKFPYILPRRKPSASLLKLDWTSFALRKKSWQRWDSNPRLRGDWCLKPAP